MISSLFSPFSLRNRDFKNRVIAAPPPSLLADSAGKVLPQMLTYYHNLADTDVGTVIVEAMAISVQGRAWSGQPGIFSSEMLNGLSRLVEKIRSRGAIPVAQLYHGGINAIPVETVVLGPSPLQHRKINARVSEIKKENLVQIVSEYAEAAKIAWNAGFSGIEIQAAEGSLPQQFMSPLTNHRHDDYSTVANGGVLFLQQVVKVVKRAVPDLLLLVSLSLKDLSPGGCGLSSAIRAASILKGEGVDIFRATEGIRFGNPLQLNPALGKSAPDAPFAEDTHIFKNETGCMTVLSGKVSTPEEAVNRIKRGTADFIALGRTLNREPLWLGGQLDSGLLQWQKCLRCPVCKAASEGCPDRPGINRWQLELKSKP